MEFVILTGLLACLCVISVRSKDERTTATTGRMDASSISKIKLLTYKVFRLLNANMEHSSMDKNVVDRWGLWGRKLDKVVGIINKMDQPMALWGREKTKLRHNDGNMELPMAFLGSLHRKRNAEKTGLPMALWGRENNQLAKSSDTSSRLPWVY